MAATFGANSTEYDDPQFQEAATHFHMGQWDNAIRLLETLQARYPGDARIGQMLKDAQFKAHLETNTEIKEKRVIIPWRSILTRVAIIGTILILVIAGFWVLRARLLPMLAEAQMQRQQAQLMNAAKAALTSGDYDSAEQRLEELLAKAPENQEATALLADTRWQRELFALYNEAMAADNAGNDELALSMYADLQMKAPGYRDVSSRILAIRHNQELDQLMGQAQNLLTLGFEPEASNALAQIQAMDVNYRRSEVSDMLYSLNMRRGKRILQQDPPQPAEVAIALEAFNAALQQKPNAPEAITEARLAVSFLRGREAYEQRNWLNSISSLRSVFAEQPNYLGNATASMLFVSMMGAGDDYFAGNDLLNAYEMYSQACQLPLADTTSACAKASSVIPLLTPTPTPTLTPTPGPTAPPPSATATATPRPLRTFRGRIIFKSDNPDLPGIYVMDPDGSNREYLGTFQRYEQAFADLRETERYSPDGTYWVSTADVDGNPQIIMHLPVTTQFGELPPKPVTRMTGMSYDPVWSPDGAWIAFVTTENESDDIWKTRPDSSEQVSLMRNNWEWDKHPSWSPDSQRIVFFSNRDGDRQLFVMDTNGRNVTNISRVPWAEYDPIWVK